MGVLTEGKALRWDETSPETRQYVKTHGIKQFISNYLKNKDRCDQKLTWGDEIEYIMVKVDPNEKTAKMYLASDSLLKILSEKEKNFNNGTITEEPIGSWKPEYGKFMIESTPFRPYGPTVQDLLRVESNMRERRLEAREHLSENEYLMCLSAFPMIGSLWSDFTYPKLDKLNSGPIANSYYIPDEIINPHIRFGTLSYNIRTRRGSKVCIMIPLFMDEKTNPLIGLAIQSVNIGSLSNSHSENEQANAKGVNGTVNGGFSCAGKKTCDPFEKCVNDYNVTVVNKVDGKQPIYVTIDDSHCNQSPTFCNKFLTDKHPSIYMDAMAFGMGCGCQQTTYQTKDVEEARFLYDNLVALCPIFLSLTASTPIIRSLLADTDARWNIVSASVDDRNPMEKKKFLKSRYDSVSLFIANHPVARKFSDLNINIDKEAYDMVRDIGVDEQLARHIGHLFIRDPLVIFSDYEEVDDETHTDHFENIQSTNWQTVRFKPPPSQDSPIGWRVEFRVMELQITDFGNAAFAVFVTLMVHAILKYNLNFYMPISKIDENMRIAHKRDSILKDVFNFVKDPYQTLDEDVDIHSVYRPMTVDEVINGSGSEEGFIGIISIINKYLDEYATVSEEERKQIDKYIRYVSLRAKGTLQTPAHYIRNFVRSHPKYQFDSVITDEIGFDLIQHLRAIQTEELCPSELTL